MRGGSRSWLLTGRSRINAGRGILRGATYDHHHCAAVHIICRHIVDMSLAPGLFVDSVGTLLAGAVSLAKKWLLLRLRMLFDCNRLFTTLGGVLQKFPRQRHSHFDRLPSFTFTKHSLLPPESGPTLSLVQSSGSPVHTFTHKTNTAVAPCLVHRQVRR
jgi:hypothetical protein